MKGMIEEGERQIVELIKIVEKLKTSYLKNENKTSRECNYRNTETRQKVKYRPVNLETMVCGDGFEKFFVLKLDEGIKKTLNSFEEDEDITRTIGGTPKRISGLGRDSFLNEVSTKEESEKMRGKDTLLDKQCNIEIHVFYNGRKGLIYLYNTDINNLDSFRTGLLDEYEVSNVEQAKWIKNARGSSFLLTLRD